MDAKASHAWMIALLCLSASIVACSPPQVTGTAIVETEDAKPEDVARTADILAARFDEITPSRRSTITATPAGHTITFTFRGEHAKAEFLRPLALTRGVLRIGPADQPDETWASDADVERVEMLLQDHTVISLRLTREAGARLLDATSKNKGRMLVTSWDGRPLLYAPILGPFGEAFQFTAPGSREEGHVVLNALRHGRLPVATKSFEYHDAADGP
jgi:hypothetical protein